MTPPACAHPSRPRPDRRSPTLLDGEPGYRVDQVWDGLYRQLPVPAEMTDLPKALRARLTEELPGCAHDGGRVRERRGRDGQVAVGAGGRHAGRDRADAYPDRVTVCVSSQAGCAMACGFCATGQAGFDRHLTTGEIVEQVVRRGPLGARPSGRLSNVVFMGMGEPLANYDRTWAAVERIHDDLGLSSRHITLSTVGVVPGIHRLADEALPVNLAVSLHAANDDLRERARADQPALPARRAGRGLPPVLDATRRRLSFEWALIDGVNDTDEQARRLAGDRPAARRAREPDPAQPDARLRDARDLACGGPHFPERLRALGVNATVRRNRGTEIDAACGQLGRPRWRCVLPDQPSPDEHRELAGADRVGEVLPALDHRAGPHHGALEHRGAARPGRPVRSPTRHRSPGGWPAGSRRACRSRRTGPRGRPDRAGPARRRSASSPRRGPTGAVRGRRRPPTAAARPRSTARNRSPVGPGPRPPAAGCARRPNRRRRDRRSTGSQASAFVTSTGRAVDPLAQQAEGAGGAERTVPLDRQVHPGPRARQVLLHLRETVVRVDRDRAGRGREPLDARGRRARRCRPGRAPWAAAG